MKEEDKKKRKKGKWSKEKKAKRHARFTKSTLHEWVKKNQPLVHFVKVHFILLDDIKAFKKLKNKTILITTYNQGPEHRLWAWNLFIPTLSYRCKDPFRFLLLQNLGGYKTLSISRHVGFHVRIVSHEISNAKIIFTIKYCSFIANSYVLWWMFNQIEKIRLATNFRISLKLVIIQNII